MGRAARNDARGCRQGGRSADQPGIHIQHFRTPGVTRPMDRLAGLRFASLPIVRRALIRNASGSVGLLQRVEIDAEMLTLLVEVAAFEAERAGDVGHMEIAAPQLGKKHLALECLHAPGERAC